MQLIRFPVTVRPMAGSGSAAGEIRVARPPLRRRLWKAGVLFLVGLGLGVLLLPIPLIHLFGVMFFLAMTGLAAKRLVSREVLKAASGHCPSCGTEGSYFVGFGGRRLSFPIRTSCPGCHLALALEPSPSSGGTRLEFTAGIPRSDR